MFYYLRGPVFRHPHSFLFKYLVITYIILKIGNGIRVHIIVHLETILVLSCPILVLLFILLYAVIHEKSGFGNTIQLLSFTWISKKYCFSSSKFIHDSPPNL